MRKYKLGRLIPVFRNILRLPRTRRYNEQMRLATLHSIIADLDKIRLHSSIIAELDEMAESKFIYTDKFGSFFDSSIKMEALVWS